MNKTTIYLTEEDARLFLMFQQHHELFEQMAEQGVFDIGFGKCVLNFAGGVLQNIVKEEVVWRR